MSNDKEKAREANRRRQARWREKHRWLGEQRRQALYGKSKEQLSVPHNAQRLEVVDPESGEVLKVWVDGRTKTGRIILLLWRQLGNVPVLDDPAVRDEPLGVQVEGF